MPKLQRYDVAEKHGLTHRASPTCVAGAACRRTQHRQLLVEPHCKTPSRTPSAQTQSGIGIGIGKRDTRHVLYDALQELLHSTHAAQMPGTSSTPVDTADARHTRHTSTFLRAHAPHVASR
ncbi:hypothetical protein [Xanthomonas prunicola]|uniref:Uncharacterized protein n=1 Tax=Xanthomonas prunicola TaxID=2053930 RepID=A0A9Q9IXM2_9XANT|nr:hypothetical protein [Xanthomonas prunicola]UXA56450.1 hypothetical protein M0D47_16895 [Xanthomonas prunicola]UXA62407.1 hypothetical protein M0D48_05305 [Xanthomonas prunicola]UXA64609.1 hypothetical protein M0D43_16975 [Xanthomonas prunicola]